MPRQCARRIAWSRLLDEGGVGTCECDRLAGVSQLLTAQLLGRPGFMQDPVPNSVNNTFMGAHCTSPTRLAGFDKPHVPFQLRNHDESGMGCVPQVLWPVGGGGHRDEVRRVRHDRPGHWPDAAKQYRGSRLRRLPHLGRLALDNVADCRDIRWFHQLIILESRITISAPMRNWRGSRSCPSLDAYGDSRAWSRVGSPSMRLPNCMWTSGLMT